MQVQEEMGFKERLTETLELSQERKLLVKNSYLMLSLAVVAAMFGGWVGATVPFFVNFFSSWVGWIVAMVLINFLPTMAIRSAHNPTTGLLALLGFGFAAGLVLGPLLYVAAYVANSPDLLFSAGLITAAVFGAVTVYVFASGRSYSAPKGLMFGMFIGLTAAVVLSLIFPLGIWGVLISIGIGIFGVISLFYSTSDLLHNEAVDSPIIGGVILFSGVFMIFQSVLYLLLAFGGGDD